MSWWDWPARRVLGETISVAQNPAPDPRCVLPEHTHITAHTQASNRRVRTVARRNHRADFWTISSVAAATSSSPTRPPPLSPSPAAPAGPLTELGLPAPFEGSIPHDAKYLVAPGACPVAPAPAVLREAHDGHRRPRRFPEPSGLSLPQPPVIRWNTTPGVNY